MARKKQSGLEHEQSQNDTWGSPVRCIDLARSVFGGTITWDPAGNPKYLLFALNTTLLPTYEECETTEHPSVAGRANLLFGDSLTDEFLDDWQFSDSVFLNPPWSDIDPWVDRLEMRKGPWAFIAQARTNAGWFHRMRHIATAFWFPCRRFPYQGAKVQPPFHSFMAFRGVSPRELAASIQTHFPKEPNPFVFDPRSTP